VAEMVAESVSRPVGAPPIEEKLSPTSKVVILIDDKTRPTPQKEALPVILERVRAAGVPADRVDIIVALGTHFPMTEEEIRERVGEDIFRTYRIRNHDSAAADQVKICELSDGFPVKVNAAFAAADVRIGIGSVLPHPFNGFGGGPKIVMPGVADYDAIRYHHATTMPKGGVVGNTTTNLFHDETARIGLASGLDLSINCVLNSREEVIDVVSGHVIEAHKAAVEKVRAAYGVSLSEDADLAILSGYPYNMFPGNQDEGPRDSRRGRACRYPGGDPRPDRVGPSPRSPGTPGGIRKRAARHPGCTDRHEPVFPGAGDEHADVEGDHGVRGCHA
jgi:nickel-dependent lactate racemase